MFMNDIYVLEADFYQTLFLTLSDVSTAGFLRKCANIGKSTMNVFVCVCVRCALCACSYRDYLIKPEQLFRFCDDDLCVGF